MQTAGDQIYLKYFRLGDTSYRQKVRFYEENPLAISALYFYDRIEVDMDYILCLFEVGKYERFLSKVDPVLEIIIMENIFKYRDENIFCDLLLKKASCLYNLNKFDKALDILRQVVKIDPQNRFAVRLFIICARKQNNDTATTIKALAMASLLIVVGIIVSQILIVDSFFDETIAFFNFSQKYIDHFLP
ncbi:MAG: hypothetical protein IPO92_14505 [Saprospiraceae bacterium]|nr:hypothetical protein [Saprospiraceae bacterium]